CWGYERNCTAGQRHGLPTSGCLNDRFLQEFWNSVDFGYVQERREEFDKLLLCRPGAQQQSMLQCSKYTRYCKAQNLFIDFTGLRDPHNRDKFRENVFKQGQIGGDCVLDRQLLQAQGDHKSPLQSWYAELENFSSMKFARDKCDVTIEHPVIFMKMDWGGNMFHHFCDFFNLYVTLHVNGSYFDRNSQIVMWDTATTHYYDPFSVSWEAFTTRPVVPLLDWADKKVCLDEVHFSLLPRMRSGLYYNTYVPQKCVGSNLFRSFSSFFLQRMQIRQLGPALKEPETPKIRVTLLQRGTPENEKIFRQIKNQKDLEKVFDDFPDLELKVVEYDWRKMSFKEQLSVTHNSDIFIGMHGAGLTHFLFLPPWAVAFELYNCDDKDCYYDLARLRGVKYVTWSDGGNPVNTPKPSEQGKHHKYGQNPKFWNWRFEPQRFKEILSEAREYVLNHATYKSLISKKLSKQKNKA
uniref:EGF domain-specific O-linked N-acetylglucosamine transferase n=1 Tax=Ciona savignyi TaxID=51511 RepID=H2ZP72_CIOSA